MEKKERFNQIVLENDDRIQRLCSYYIPNPEDRKDLYQEILVNIWKSIENFKGNSSISTYVYRIAMNTSLTFKGKTLSQFRLCGELNSKILDKLSGETTFPDKLEQETQFEDLEKELYILSIIDKAIITLLLEGLSMKEISNIIGITEPNVKVKIHRIKTHLKTKLKGVSHE